MNDKKEDQNKQSNETEDFKAQMLGCFIICLLAGGAIFVGLQLLEKIWINERQKLRLRNSGKTNSMPTWATCPFSWGIGMSLSMWRVLTQSVVLMNSAPCISLTKCMR